MKKAIRRDFGVNPLEGLRRHEKEKSKENREISKPLGGEHRVEDIDCPLEGEFLEDRYQIDGERIEEKLIGQPKKDQEIECEIN